MVFQTYALYPHLTVEDNMGFGLKMTGHPKDEIATKVAEASRILKLEDYLKRKPAALSGDQRQRVAIGRAIVRGPEVFLFDEPRSNLDAELRVDMRVEIARLHNDLGNTMIYRTHDQVEAMTLADKIVVLRAGLIEQVGAPMDLHRDPDNRFVVGFSGSPSMNFLKGKVVEGRVEVPALGGEVIGTDIALPAPGSAMIVGIRPQEASLIPAPSSLKVDITEQLGGVAYDYLSTPTGESLVIESKDDDAVMSGTEVTIGYDASRVLFFDAETEKRPT
jgi:lactose/L-arabinose transport system ATP-binding protein